MPRKLAKNIAKGDLILLHDEERWMMVTDVTKENNLDNGLYKVLVWFKDDDMAVHYPPDYLVDYAQGGQVGQARKAGQPREAGHVSASEWRRFMEITQYLDEHLTDAQCRSLTLHLIDQLSAKDRALILRSLRHDQRQENRERGWPQANALDVQWEDPKLNPSTYVSMQTRIVGDKLKDSGELK